MIASASCAWLQDLLSNADLVSITDRIAACRDPTDDRFLEQAVNGNAAVIVSVDADRLVLHPFRNIPIIAPATFVQAAARLD